MAGINLWLTRDRDEDGDLMEWVDVWLDEPVRHLNPLRKSQGPKGADYKPRSTGGYWLAANGGGPSGQISVETAHLKHGVLLTTDLLARRVEV